MSTNMHAEQLQDQRDTLIRLTEAVKALTQQIAEMHDDLRTLKEGKVLAIYTRQHVQEERLSRLQWIVYGCVGGLGSIAAMLVGSLLLWAITK